MNYICRYNSPLGNMLIASDGTSITGLWFEGQKHYAHGLNKEYAEYNLTIFNQAKKWLDIYFSGKEPDFHLPVRLTGTAFQKEVWSVLRTIPYGEAITYGDIAKHLAKSRGIPHMSAQAVGGAVGSNPISIIVPCHRVVGANGSLTGYAGGVDKKLALLTLENSNIPVKNT